ncbi:substrate-binding domain-containing protein [Bacillus tianshenii]|uniref:PstS family phosphate ABC transporter substrate-binding protein n=1 Tax=Sutcliffiella tianshenii TaxID=1463404 RepID=UPI001CD6B74A|nr:substrate-binding domain-containing protein [Bacillus tianshenii]MCA1319581.1 substrate-binding domain-containing protein [Bacillus tianshenii]
MRVIASFMVSVMILFVGFYATVMTLLSTGKEQYGVVVAFFVLTLLVFANLLVWDRFSNKAVKYSFIGLISCFILFVVFENVKSWHLKSLQVMSTQDVDLSVYEPFAKDSLVATLDASASFKMEEPLLKLDGSTALYPIFAAFAQAVYPKDLYDSAGSEVQSTQTSGAWVNLMKEESDLIFAPEPPITIQDLAKSKEVQLELTPIGKEAFVFFVHKDNPVSDITLEDVQNIYSGEITNWKELGGKDEAILAFQRPEDSGSQQMLMKVMGAKRLMEAPKDQQVTGMGGIIEETLDYENRKNAIGFSFRFFSETMVQNNKIKHLSINGVSPSITSIQEDTYPFVSPFYAVHLSTSTNPNLVPFLEWMQSDEGQTLVEKSGYVPYYK